MPNTINEIYNSIVAPKSVSPSAHSSTSHSSSSHTNTASPPAPQPNNNSPVNDIYKNIVQMYADKEAQSGISAYGDKSKGETAASVLQQLNGGLSASKQDQAKNPTFLERAGLTTLGAAQQYAGSHLNTAAAYYEGATRGSQAEYERLGKLAQEQVLEAHEAYKSALKEANYNMDDKSVQRTKRILDSAINEARMYQTATTDAVKNDLADITKKFYNAADTVSNAGTQNLERAKQGAGFGGRLAVDVGAGALQMAGDIATGKLFTAPGAAVNILPIMAARTFGSGAAEARNAGASYERQVAYGGATALIEIMTEKMSDIPGLVGGGVADDAINTTIRHMANTLAGMTALRLAFAFKDEAVEEIVSGALSPVAKAIYDNGAELKGITSSGANAWEFAKETLYEGLVGGLLGLGGTARSQIAYGSISTENAKARAANDAESRLTKRGFDPKTASEQAELISKQLADESLSAEEKAEFDKWPTAQEVLQEMQKDGVRAVDEKADKRPGNILAKHKATRADEKIIANSANANLDAYTQHDLSTLYEAAYRQNDTAACERVLEEQAKRVNELFSKMSRGEVLDLSADQKALYAKFKNQLQNPTARDSGRPDIYDQNTPPASETVGEEGVPAPSDSDIPGQRLTGGVTAEEASQMALESELDRQAGEMQPAQQPVPITQNRLFELASQQPAQQEQSAPSTTSIENDTIVEESDYDSDENEQLIEEGNDVYNRLVNFLENGPEDEAFQRAGERILDPLTNKLMSFERNRYKPEQLRQLMEQAEAFMKGADNGEGRTDGGKGQERETVLAGRRGTGTLQAGQTESGFYAADARGRGETSQQAGVRESAYSENTPDFIEGEVIREQDLDESQRALIASAVDDGFDSVTLMFGEHFSAHGFDAGGYVVDGKLFLANDAPETPNALKAHEDIHLWAEAIPADSRYITLRGIIVGIIGEENFISAIQTYTLEHDGKYTSLNNSEFQTKMCEEILGDMYGGLDRFDVGIGNYKTETADAIKEYSFRENYLQYKESKSNGDSGSAYSSKRAGLAKTLNALLGGDSKAIAALSDDELNYAINYTLKQVDPELDFGEKRRGYNAIANVLSGSNLGRDGLRRGQDFNIISPERGIADQVMTKRADNNKLYQAVTFGQLGHDDYITRKHANNSGMEFGRLQTLLRDSDRITNRERAVLTAAINELDRRGKNLWGYDIGDRQSMNGKLSDSRKEALRDKAPRTLGEYNTFSRKYLSQEEADESSDEFNEAIERYEQKQATKDLAKMREGDNFVKGAVGVSPEVQVGKDGRRYQGWYDIYEQSLSEVESAKQRVMKYRSAQALADEVFRLESQLEDARDEVNRMIRNAPRVKSVNKQIYNTLDSLNDDIEDLHAVEELFKTATGEEARELAEFGSRILAGIDEKRDQVNRLGEQLEFEKAVFEYTHDIEIEQSRKRLSKAEGQIAAKRSRLASLQEASKGGETSGALVDSRRPTAFDDMPTDIIRRILNDGKISQSMLEQYYDPDRAFEIMQGFKDKDSFGRTVTRSEHKLTALEKSGLHRILAERKNGARQSIDPREIRTGMVDNATITNDFAEPREFSRGDKALFESKLRGGDYSPPPYNPKLRQFSQGEDARRIASGSKDTSTVPAAETGEIAARNLSAYQERMREDVGEVIEPSRESSPRNLGRLNKMFAERLGIANTGNTSVAFANQDNRTREQAAAEDGGSGYFTKSSKRSDDAQTALEKKCANIIDGKGVLFESSTDADQAPVHDDTDDPKHKLTKEEKKEQRGRVGGKSAVNPVTPEVSQAMLHLQEDVTGILKSDTPIRHVLNLANSLTSYQAEDSEMNWLTSKEINDTVKEIQDAYGMAEEDVDAKAQRMAAATAKLLALVSTKVERAEANRAKGFAFEEAAQKNGKEATNALSKARYFHDSWRFNPTTQFKMIDGFDKGSNGIGYQLAKQVEDSVAKEQIMTGDIFTRYAALQNEEGAREFAEGKSMCKVPVPSLGTITEQQAVELIKAIRTLAYQEVGDRHRLDTIAGFTFVDKNGNETSIKRSDLKSSKESSFFEDMRRLEHDMLEKLSPAAKKYIEITDDILFDLGNEVSKVKQQVTGVGFDRFDKGNYYPVRYRSPAHQTDYTESQRQGGLFDPFTDRTRTTGGYVYIGSAADTVDSYIRNAIYAASYANLSDTLDFMNSTALGMRGMTNVVGDNYGKSFAKAFNNYTNDVAQRFDKDSSGFNKAMGKARSLLQQGALRFSVSVPIKQTASYWDAMGTLSPQALREAYRLKATKAKGYGKGNPILDVRAVGGIDPTLSEILNDKGYLSDLKKKSKIAEAWDKAISVMDYRTVDDLYHACIIDTKLSYPNIDVNSKMFKDIVTMKFQEVVLNTQPVFNANARSQAARTRNEAVHMLSMFQTQQTQNYNRLVTTIGEAKAAGEQLSPIAKRSLRQTIAGQVAAVAEFSILQMIADAVLHRKKQYKDDDDDKLNWNKLFGRFFMNAAESAAGTLWLGDQLSKIAIDFITGDSSSTSGEFRGFSVGPLTSAFSAFDSVLKAAVSVKGAAVERDPSKLDINSIRYGVTNTAQLFGVPANNVASAINSIAMYGLDAIYTLTGGKAGNRLGEDKFIKIVDSWIKGNMTAEGAKRQIGIALKHNEPENLLYNVGILEASGAANAEKAGKDDPHSGHNYLADILVGKTAEAKAATKKAEEAEYGRTLSGNERIANYLVGSGLSTKDVDDAVDKYATSGGYNVFYDALRSRGMKPADAVNELYKSDNKSGMTTDIRSEDSVDALLSGVDKSGDTYDVPPLQPKNVDEYVNYATAKKVFIETKNYRELDKLIKDYDRLNANTKEVLDAKDDNLAHLRECSKLGVGSAGYYGVKQKMDDVKVEMDKSTASGTPLKMIALSRANLTDKQREALLESDWMGISKTGKTVYSVLSKYGMSMQDVGEWIYNADLSWDDSNGTLSNLEVAQALRNTSSLTDPQRRAIYKELEPLLTNPHKINDWGNYSYDSEIAYIDRKGLSVGRGA